MKKLAILLLVFVVFGACDENTWVDSSGPATTADPAATTTTADPAATTTTADPAATTTTAEPISTADPAATTTTAEPTTTTVTKGPGGSASYTYDLIPMENYDDYPLIPSLRDMGIQLVLAESLKNGHITSTEVVLQTTNSVERRLGSNNNEFYRFNCSLANGNNKTQTVMAFFVARHNTVTLVDAVPYWYYLAHMFWVANPTTSVVETDQTPPVTEPEPVEEEEEEEEEEVEEEAPPVTTPVTSTSTDTILYPWILQPAADYGSEFHVDNANYGMNYFVSQEVTKGNITNGTYSIKLIDEIWKQVLPNVTNYRYITQVDKAEDNYTYNVTFGIRFLNSNNARSMGFYRFQMLDANGNPIGKGALPDLEPVKNASQTVTTTTVDGNPVSTTTGGITVDP